MKKLIFCWVTAWLMAYSQATACELYWYLAASMSKPGREVTETWNRQPDRCQVTLILGGSGQLLSQLYLAKQGDIYTPASETFLDKARSFHIVKSSRVLLEQKPVFGLSRSGVKQQIKTLSDLTRPGVKIALGNPKTMALGKTYLDIEARFDPELKQKIRTNSRVEAINISQVVNYILSDIVDAGIVFDTTATANSIPYIEIPEKYNVTNRAYLATLTFTSNAAQAERFETFVSKQFDSFKKYGFSLIHSPK